jgi:hypothetical protein
MIKTVLIIIVVLGIITAWLITRPAVPKPYVEAYQSALDRLPGSDEAIDAGIERFQTVYSDLTDDAVADRVRDLYAETLYFNDTLATFESREALAGYMQKTGESLDRSSVQIDSVMRDGSDVFVRWTMTFSTSSMGRVIDSESIGMTHLRFDTDGRVLLHQDFWDAASGLYRNLPVVGYGLDLVDQRMADAHND